ncbi:Hypothetical protein HVR_LOCUS102 [uncultured virus]|nr:Hypothetical protein HVR_LOCUS102 [uncultured virus]
MASIIFIITLGVGGGTGLGVGTFLLVSKYYFDSNIPIYIGAGLSLISILSSIITWNLPSREHGIATKHVVASCLMGLGVGIGIPTIAIPLFLELYIPFRRLLIQPLYQSLFQPTKLRMINNFKHHHGL